RATAGRAAPRATGARAAAPRRRRRRATPARRRPPRPEPSGPPGGPPPRPRGRAARLRVRAQPLLLASGPMREAAAEVLARHDVPGRLVERDARARELAAIEAEEAAVARQIPWWHRVAFF